jgi:hypothetical protein
MKIAETIYTHIQKVLFFYLFWPCPATFGIFLLEDNTVKVLIFMVY